MIGIRCVADGAPSSVIMNSATTRGAALVVEDPFIRKYVRRILDRVPYDSVEADPQNAAAVLAVADPRIRLVITNQPEVFAAFASEIALVYVSAFPDLSLAARFRFCEVLRKPFLPEDLVRAVEALTPAFTG